MKIGIIGLGLIGASYAKRLSKTYDIYGYDIDASVMKRMQKDSLKGNALEHLASLDIVVLALNPPIAKTFMEKHGDELKDTVLLTDVCGVKKPVVSFIESRLGEKQSYLSHHPMSGNPEGGFENSSPTLFENANLVYVTTEKTKESDLGRLNSVLEKLGFSSFSVMDATTHDTHIAHTSQLTHLISSVLVLSNDAPLPKEVMGNSYRDLTRIADIEPDMWSELFMENKQALIHTLDDFQTAIETFKTHLENNDKASIKTLLEKTRNRYRQNK